MLPMCPDHGEHFDHSFWQAYVSANKIFADKVMEIISPDDDYVWSNLDSSSSHFPSSEIYRTLLVQDEILRGLLNCDLIGFHTFDYVCHFLSCCGRMLVYIKILPVGVHMGRLESVLNLPATSTKVKEIQEQFKGMKVILGVDDMDIFKGIILVQIVNPARGSGKDVEEAKKETYLTAKRINEAYVDRPVPRYEKSAYYAVAECCIVNAMRDGMNLVPYKYIVYRQGTPSMDEALGIMKDAPRTSMLAVSEFIGCSPSLIGAIRVNPWDVDAMADALSLAINMSSSEKQLRHEKHYKYVSTHDVAYWACSFTHDLERACRDHYKKRCWAFGLGLRFRVLSLSPSFRRRAIFLDYDGTVVPETSISKMPGPEVLSVLNTLCNDTMNTVFIISGRGRRSLSEWLSSCKMLGIAAEHGYFIRWNSAAQWKTSSLSADLDWKNIVEPIMKLYTEATDGSSIEYKESALVWHHQDADPDFGSCQAKELLAHLESVLANEPAVVKRGQQIVEDTNLVVGHLGMGNGVPRIALTGRDSSVKDLSSSVGDSSHWVPQLALMDLGSNVKNLSTGIGVSRSHARALGSQFWLLWMCLHSCSGPSGLIWVLDAQVGVPSLDSRSWFPDYSCASH
ncbi:hypothetical protein ACJRO7_016063 [Eucalyptus globulus]|uniref:Uncharacterized protein n=1 Tax=Eucalyptus globulus TaxID=34317 RepID=A0ABD3L6L4_EUCGL